MDVNVEQAMVDFMMFTSQSSHKDCQIKTIYAAKYSKDNSTISHDMIYFSMGHFASKWFKELYDTKNFDEFLDCGSPMTLCSYLSTFAKCTYIEARQCSRPLAYDVFNMKIVNAQAQQLPIKSSSFSMLTCLHALEHFGLGRYGDDIDAMGDLKALFEFNRVLKPGGFLMLCVPTGESSVVNFNDERIYAEDDISNMLSRSSFKPIRMMKLDCSSIAALLIIAQKQELSEQMTSTSSSQPDDSIT